MKRLWTMPMLAFLMIICVGCETLLEPLSLSGSREELSSHETVPSEEPVVEEQSDPALSAPESVEPELVSRFSELALEEVAVPVTGDTYLEIGAARCETTQTPSAVVPGATDCRYRMHNAVSSDSFELSFVHQGGGMVAVTLTVGDDSVASYTEENALERFGERCEIRWLDNYTIWVAVPNKVGTYDVVLEEFRSLGDGTVGLGYPAGFWEVPNLNDNVGLVHLQTDRMAPIFWAKFEEAMGLYHSVGGRIRVLETWTPTGAERPAILWDDVSGGSYYSIAGRKSLWFVASQNGRKTLMLDSDEAEVAAIENGMALVRRKDEWLVKELATGAVALTPQGRYVGLLYGRYFVFQEEALAFIDPYTSTIFTYPAAGEAALEKTILGTQYLTIGGESHRPLLGGEELH